MLAIQIRQLREGPVPTDLELAPDDPALAGVGMQLVGPVKIAGVVQATMGEDFLWRADLSARVAGTCRRCLEPVEEGIGDRIEVVFSSNPELLDDPSVYQIPPHPVELDLTEAVREELLLRDPAFPLCRPDCRGLCARCGADLNAGPCGCADGTTN